ncbi:MAG: hypothetical protein JWM82_218, partial [Myxococcales bacterium]|nr:hypothetical protein [Myxococcales bacterium]
MSTRARSGARVTGGLALAALAACNSAPADPHGVPVLLGVHWVAGDSTSLVWAPDSTPDIAVSAPPFVSEIDFVFDRRLDGARIEDMFTVGGVAMTGPSNNPPIHVASPGLPSSWSASSYTVQYNSLGIYGSTTSYVFLRPRAAGLPSGEVVTFDLDRARFANSYGESLASPSSVSIPTSRLTVSVSAPPAPVAGTYQLPFTFSNRMSLSSSASAAFHVRAGGADVPFALVADANVASRWYVVPADCLGRWPASTTFVVVVDPDLPDAFGGKLSAGATATFKTGAGGAATQDCGVAPLGDAGTEAGGAVDAGAETGTEDAAAADASGDAAGAGAADASADSGPE